MPCSVFTFSGRTNPSMNTVLLLPASAPVAASPSSVFVLFTGGASGAASVAGVFSAWSRSSCATSAAGSSPVASAPCAATSAFSSSTLFCPRDSSVHASSLISLCEKKKSITPSVRHKTKKNTQRAGEMEGERGGDCWRRKRESASREMREGERMVIGDVCNGSKGSPCRLSRTGGWGRRRSRSPRCGGGGAAARRRCSGWCRGRARCSSSWCGRSRRTRW